MEAQKHIYQLKKIVKYRCIISWLQNIFYNIFSVKFAEDKNEAIYLGNGSSLGNKGNSMVQMFSLVALSG